MVEHSRRASPAAFCAAPSPRAFLAPCALPAVLATRACARTLRFLALPPFCWRANTLVFFLLPRLRICVRCDYRRICVHLPRAHALPRKTAYTLRFVYAALGCAAACACSWHRAPSAPLRSAVSPCAASGLYLLRRASHTHLYLPTGFFYYATFHRAAPLLLRSATICALTPRRAGSAAGFRAGLRRACALAVPFCAYTFVSLLPCLYDASPYLRIPKWFCCWYGFCRRRLTLRLCTNACRLPAFSFLMRFPLAPHLTTITGSWSLLLLYALPLYALVTHLRRHRRAIATPFHF